MIWLQFVYLIIQYILLDTRTLKNKAIPTHKGESIIYTLNPIHIYVVQMWVIQIYAVDVTHERIYVYVLVLHTLVNHVIVKCWMMTMLL